MIRKAPGVLVLICSFGLVAMLMTVVLAWSASAQQPQDTPQQASNPNPMASVLQRWWAIADYVVSTAEAMPATKYAYKPFAEVRSFGDQIGHVADEHYLRCSAVRGEPSPAATIEGSVTTKDELVSKLKQSVAYCSAVYQTMTDANLAKPWQQGSSRGINLGPLVANIAHDNEHASTMIMLMRMSGIKPVPFE